MSESISELFSRNPLDLTDEDIDEIIRHMREQRKNYNALPAGSKGPAKLTKAQEETKKISLDIKL